jgi:hypothetical protein
MDPVKILIFSSTREEGLVFVTALCECGHLVSGQTCADESMIEDEMGISSTKRHDEYSRHCEKFHDGQSFTLQLIGERRSGKDRRA